MNFKTVFALIGVFLLFEYCGQISAGSSPGNSQVIQIDSGVTLLTRFNVPEGFKRPLTKGGAFVDYLRSIPLKPAGSQVHLYDGRLKSSQDVHAAVLDIDVGNEDLQQCADAVMRLRGEYLFNTKQYEKLHFNLTNGFRVDYTRWIQGYRVTVNGNSTQWVKSKPASNTYADFKAYITFVYRYAGTLSLSGELRPVEMVDIQPGDVFVRGGSPGHAVIVLDVAENPATQEKIFLLAQSYMPAQEIHVLKNPEDPDISPWYSTKFTGDLKTPEWTFSHDELMRFPRE